jgi:ribonuclease VapC
MFVDASAIVAILTREAEADPLADRLDEATCITSAIAVFEAVAAIVGSVRLVSARREPTFTICWRFTQVSTVPLTAADGDTELEAFDRYGKGRNHPAQLNLADCFAYAMATNRGVPLLFRGEDFDKTDIADGR